MKLLLAFDATQDGRTALLGTPELAWLPHDDVCLLGVMPMPSGLFLGEGYVPGEILDADRQAAQTLVDDGAAQLRERGFVVTARLAFGEPVEEICAAARALGSDLIVVRHPKRMSFAARWWRGWIGASLIEHAPCSVLIAVSH